MSKPGDAVSEQAKRFSDDIAAAPAKALAVARTEAKKQAVRITRTTGRKAVVISGGIRQGRAH